MTTEHELGVSGQAPCNHRWQWQSEAQPKVAFGIRSSALGALRVAWPSKVLMPSSDKESVRTGYTE